MKILEEAVRRGLRGKEWLLEVGAEPLEGAPSVPNIPGYGPIRIGQNPEILRAAEEYSQRTGIPLRHLEQYVPMDWGRAGRVASAFDEMPHAPDDPEVRRAYSALADETLGQYESMLSAGIEPYFIRGADPYAASPYLSLLDLDKNKRLGVFPTDDGFGTDEAFDVTGNPLLEMSPFKIGGEPARVNDIFRAVHDYFGHGGPGVGFRAMGEENAYQSHAGMFTPLARRALASETRGQNSWLNAGPYGETNRTAGIEDTVFAPQKTGLMPRWASEEGLTTTGRAPARLSEFEGALNDEGRLVLEHWSGLPNLDTLDPAKFGSRPGSMLRTPEVRRGGIPRTFYGIPAAQGGYQRESILGPHRYTTTIAPDLLYDVMTDPEGLVRRAGGNVDEWERAIRERNYPGYYANHPQLGKTAQVFDPLKVQRGRADPRLLAGVAGGTGALGLAGMLSPEEAQAAFVDDSLLAGGNLLESVGRDLWGAVTGLVTGDREQVEGITEPRTLPQSAAGEQVGALVGDALGAGFEAAAPAMRGLLDYQPPLRDQTVGEDLGSVVDWWQGLDDSTQTRLGGAGTLLGMAGVPGRSTIRGAQRKAFPGVYKEPGQLLEEVPVAPEDPILGQLWGVTREDLARTAERQGNEPGVLPGATAGGAGAKSAQPVMAPANTRRLVNALEAARDTPLGVGMRGWYVMDPVYNRMEELFGPEEAQRRYRQFNTLSGMASPGSDVATELNRGTAANWLAEEGRFDDFVRYGGAADRGPEDMRNVLGHAYHRTHAGPMQQYLETGSSQMQSPKVPLYFQASGVPQTGFQTDSPVGDAHWSRAVGLADTRTGKEFSASVTNPEAKVLTPWWRDQVAGQVGLESVPAQAVAWGLFGPQTGVRTAVGAPKLEILSQEIRKAAQRAGITPEEARDRILAGKMHAGFVDPKLLPWIAAAAAGGWLALGGPEGTVEESGVAERFRPRQVE